MDKLFEGSLEAFRRVLADPFAYVKQWKEKNAKSVIGYFCSYTPEEIILAANALPFRIFNSGRRIVGRGTPIE